MQTSTDQYIDQQISEQRKRFVILRRQRTYLELAKTLKGADLPIIEAALDEINNELAAE